MSTALEIINTIRDNMDEEYIARVPEATRENLQQVGDAITSTKNIMNEFMGALINKVALSLIKSKMYTNPLAKLKEGVGKPMGSTIEEIFVNPSTDMGYQADGSYLLKSNKPDGKACYYGLNRQSTYPTSINKDQLVRAFNSEESFNRFYGGIIQSLYSGDQIDEFLLMKNMIGKNIDANTMKIVECDIAQPKEVAKAMANTSDYFTFPSTQYNGYNLAYAEEILAGEKPCITFCEPQNQVLLIRADASNEINFEVLASMFNMEIATLKTMTIKVDDIPSTTHDVYAILCDREAVVVIDSVFDMDSQYIGSNRTWNFWLHHYQWLYFSLFANAVAFGKKITE